MPKSGTTVAALAVLGVIILGVTGAFFANPARAWAISAAVLGVALTVSVALFLLYDETLASRSVVSGAFKDVGPVGPVASFWVVAFITAGFGAVIVATPNWPVASLWGGAMLLGGGFLGLLFGLPIQAAGTNTPNLLADITSTISKIVTGAITVELSNIYQKFKVISAYLQSGFNCCGGNSSFAAGLLLYFLALGFVSGLILSKFYINAVFVPEAVQSPPQSPPVGSPAIVVVSPPAGSPPSPPARLPFSIR